MSSMAGHFFFPPNDVLTFDHLCMKFRAWTDVLDLAEKIREGKTKWEDLDLDDVDIRFKWAGLFHRPKRTPGKFMMRIKV